MNKLMERDGDCLFSFEIQYSNIQKVVKILHVSAEALHCIECNPRRDMAIRLLSSQEAYHYCNPDKFTFETTAEVDGVTRFIGQERALEAVGFGIGIRHQGFNLFVLGPEGFGRHSVVQSFIDEKAVSEETPTDWCYVQNFKHGHRPLALEFEPGMGAIFQKEMDELIDMLKTTIPTVIEGEDYQSRKLGITESLQQKIDALYHGVEERAKEEGIAVIKTEQGILFTARDAEQKPMSSQDFMALPKEERKSYESLIEKYQLELQQAINQVSILKREAEEKGRVLKKETARLTVSHLISALYVKYKENEPVISYLKDVEEEITENVDDFLRAHEPEKGNPFIGILSPAATFHQYKVNVLVSHEEKGAPVIYEDLPTYQNLHGRIEHHAKMGVLSTHFTLIQKGSLHQANGGYLIIDAGRLLRQPFAYEGLKRTLRSEKIRIEPVERLLGLMSTVTLEPEPIPLQTKVVLIGDPMLYYLLNAYDPEFQSLFKVQADFEHTMVWNEENQQLYVSLLANLTSSKGLLPLHRQAVAKVIEQAAREASDREKLSLHLSGFVDLLQEADYLARKGNNEYIGVEVIEAAISTAKRRGDRVKDRIQEGIHEGIRRIETSGSKIGQINGLSVMQLGNSYFGMPTRITAQTRPGGGKLIDIEREVKLGGALHSKGVLILEAYLSATYAYTIPLSLRASLVFEQSYGGVDGDSASCAELCALLSSLAKVPLKQSLAITGSISQLGEVQAIGGVNEKIEGFFDICRHRGLNGEQGVIIPAANIRHLMLKKSVLDAIDAKRFQLYGVDTVDDALELLTGLQAGRRGEEDVFEKDSVNRLVEEQLYCFARDLQEFKQDDKESKE